MAELMRAEDQRTAWTRARPPRLPVVPAGGTAEARDRDVAEGALIVADRAMG
jgi:hypothetical protein